MLIVLLSWSRSHFWWFYWGCLEQRWRLEPARLLQLYIKLPPYHIMFLLLHYQQRQHKFTINAFFQAFYSFSRIPPKKIFCHTGLIASLALWLPEAPQEHNRHPKATSSQHHGLTLFRRGLTSGDLSLTGALWWLMFASIPSADLESAKSTMRKIRALSPESPVGMASFVTQWQSETRE